MDAAIDAAVLHAVDAGAGQPQRRKERIEIGDATTADEREGAAEAAAEVLEGRQQGRLNPHRVGTVGDRQQRAVDVEKKRIVIRRDLCQRTGGKRSEEHTSELQSPMRISYAVFCLKNNKKQKNNDQYY